MGYWVLSAALALWVCVDGMRRSGFSGIFWGVGTFLLAPLVLPVYFAVRPLREGETREGGKAWNVLKGFALTWTLLMVASGISGVMALSEQAALTQEATDAEKAGTAIGGVIGLMILAVVWFFPMVGAMLLGFFLRKSSVVERGPTGRQAEAQSPVTIAPA